MTLNFKRLLIPLLITLSLSSGSLTAYGSSQAITATSQLPFKYSIKPDGYLYSLVNGQEFLTEFTAWGGHAFAQAGGHLEGNNKSNFAVHILPKGQTVEVLGNSDGVCDSGELCGATLANIRSNELWYTATYPHMKLIGFSRDQMRTPSPYIPGEPGQWRLFFSFDGGLNLQLQHVAELSPQLIQLIKNSGQALALNISTNSYGRGPVPLRKPVSLPDGIKLARPEIIQLAMNQVGGQNVYAADAQTEWSIVPTQPIDRRETCQWNYFTPAMRAKMQKILDTELLKPIPGGRFVSGAGGGVGIESAAEGVLCASDSFQTSPGLFTQISANNSFGFFQVNSSNHPSGRVFSVFPIHTTSAAYQANKALYSPGAQYMFRTGPDISGFSNTSNFQIVLKEASQTYTLQDLTGEIVDLATSTDTVKNNHFTVKIYRVGGSSEPASSSGSALLGKYFGVRYRLEKSRAIVAWGDLSDSQAGVVLPPAIPANADCSSAAFSCYIHDFSLFR